jgi:prolipoprotein diacylglyceryltransferase
MTEGEICLVLIPPALAIGLFLRWGFKNLPRDGFQVLVSAPGKREGSGAWTGTNYTYYGLFQAIASVAALVWFVALMASVGVSARHSLLTAAALFVFCLPASSLLARTVERRPNTLTIGGASFVGALAAPLVISAINRTLGGVSGPVIPLLPALAALASAYALGEGMGRQACISFGCCYGKPMSECGPLFRRLFAKSSFVFWGPSKKIAYEGGLEGVEVAPIQAITASVLVSLALPATALFFAGRFGPAFLVAAAGAGVWRVISEFFRADYRGEGKLSAYQWMALVSVVFACALYWAFDEPTQLRPSLREGISALWDPLVIIGVQLIGLAVFFHSGKSKVTAARIFVYVRKSG